MKIQIMSDLRLESPRPQSPRPRGAPMYDVFKIPPKAPYLVLLGNIGAIKDAGFFSFIEAQLSQFAIVLFVLGNREPYLATWSETKQKLHRFAASVNERSAASGQSGQPKTGSFVFLDQNRYDISSDVTVLGCTLFTHVSKSNRSWATFGSPQDFYDIYDWIVEKHCAAQRSDLAWLNSQVSRISAEEPHRKIVVFTHHSPITQDARGVYLRLAHSSVLERFATDLSAQECWTNPSVRLWAFGHTHYNVNYVEDSGKMVLSNQRSWLLCEINGTKGFDGDLVVDI